MHEVILNLARLLFIILFLLFLVYLLQGHIKKVIESVKFSLVRKIANPLLSPHGLNDWESQSVFNPAAITDDDGLVHLLYRAIGMDGLSKIGHAQSHDGINFTRRFGYPVFQQMPTITSQPDTEKVYNPAQYTSGGGWGGCEDPRAVRIDDRIFMTYTAFEGWHSVRIALTSISTTDFKRGSWDWKKPLLLSAPGTVEKNWVLFPEKINGKFAIIHSISPDIKIDYIDDFETLNRNQQYIRSQNAPTKGGRPDYWDNWMRGAAAPPIKTEKGWLLLYHAMDKNDPGKYKLGAMLLDLDDPTKILYRSPTPLLSPDMHYENDEKPGVIYASGAVVIDGKLHVYYGGGDKYICSADANLNELLNWLIKHGSVN